MYGASPREQPLVTFGSDEYVASLLAADSASQHVSRAERHIQLLTRLGAGSSDGYFSESRYVFTEPPPLIPDSDSSYASSDGYLSDSSYVSTKPPPLSPLSDGYSSDSSFVSSGGYFSDSINVSDVDNIDPSSSYSDHSSVEGLFSAEASSTWTGALMAAVNAYADSGATYHCQGSEEGLHSVEDCKHFPGVKKQTDIRNNVALYVPRVRIPEVYYLAQMFWRHFPSVSFLTPSRNC